MINLVLGIAIGAAFAPFWMEAFDTDEGRRLLNQHCGITF